ncbi:hypothetical protein B0H66DRAFT_533825 [Apodospora peruviana]|uniref:Uncharacterized protein n=1 Tax=Apodospora peruviana TaxID=516989 RepID=A0AAE0M5D9_9PEZI|nr:hypothetical protein B0H66DRAFT_533825 [Apodospora peruviana]
MGCAESREEDPDSERLLSSFQPAAHDYSLPCSVPRMGQPSSQPEPFRPAPGPIMPSQLASQHERLLLELLPFHDSRRFHEWLNSIYVRGSWNEFLHDFLVHNPAAPEPDKSVVTNATRDAIHSRNPKYLVYHPNKEGWTSDDHHIRFMATLISDNRLQNLWSDGDWRKRSEEITKAAYEVLGFLRSIALTSDLGPPGYEDFAS